MRTSPFVTKAKPIAECTPQELAEVRSIARAHAVRKRRPHLDDEFASYVMEDLAKQGTLYYNLHWLWATFLRGQFGNLASKQGRAKATARTKPVPIEKAYKIADTKKLPDESDPLNVLISRFHDRERAVVVLKFKWGMSDREIGDVFGISPVRVNQILQVVYQEIRAKGLESQLRKSVA